MLDKCTPRIFSWIKKTKISQNQTTPRVSVVHSHWHERPRIILSNRFLLESYYSETKTSFRGTGEIFHSNKFHFLIWFSMDQLTATPVRYEDWKDLDQRERLNSCHLHNRKWEGLHCQQKVKWPHLAKFPLQFDRFRLVTLSRTDSKVGRLSAAH